MENIEVGDYVVCIDNHDQEETLKTGQEYLVEGLWGSYGKHPIVLGGFFHSSRFYLARKADSSDDDVLPEIESFRYRFEVYEGDEELLDVIDSKQHDEVLLIQERRSWGQLLRNSIFKLTADDALDLAHDLTRMAMQIKRRLKD